MASALPPPYHRPPATSTPLFVRRSLTVSLSSSMRSFQAISVTATVSTCITALAYIPLSATKHPSPSPPLPRAPGRPEASC